MPRLASRRIAVLTLAALGLGVALPLQWRTPAAPSVLAESYYRGAAAGAVERLESEQRALKAEIATLQQEVQAQQRAAASRKATLEGLSRDIEQQKMLAGLTPVHGPGVYLVLQDSGRQPLPGDDPGRYLVRDFHLRDVLNLLWQGGAEAISVNDERIVATTAIYGTGNAILINASRVVSPYEVRALGNPERLERVVADPASLKALKAAAGTYGLGFRLSRERDLPLPAYGGAFPLRYASVREG